MAEQHQHGTPPHGGHETRDIDARLLGLAGLSLVILLLGSLALMAWLAGILMEPPALQGAPLAATRPRAPGPGLQTTPQRDLQEMRRTEQELLQSYAWLDRTAGIARIPLQRALELVAERGLPVWQELPTSPQAPGGEVPEGGQ